MLDESSMTDTEMEGKDLFKTNIYFYNLSLNIK